MIRSGELITTDKAVREGLGWQTKKFQELSIEVEIGAKKIISKIKKISREKNDKGSKIFLSDLIKHKDILSFLTSSLGYSEKKLKNLSEKEILREIKLKIEVDKIESESYLRSLMFHYALTAGNSLGGKMNNIIGRKGNELFCRYMFEIFDEQNIKYKTIEKNDNIQYIKTEDFIVYLNKKPKFINKSIDFIILERNKYGDFDIEDPTTYISAGELKSGVDPAGADEHWKTATTALKRIHEAFDKIDMPKPDLYFIGGAISRNMSKELVDAIKNDFLSGAANLSKKEQVKNVISSFLLRKKPKNERKQIKRQSI